MINGGSGATTGQKSFTQGWFIQVHPAGIRLALINGGRCLGVVFFSWRIGGGGHTPRLAPK